MAERPSDAKHIPLKWEDGPEIGAAEVEADGTIRATVTDPFVAGYFADGLALAKRDFAFASQGEPLTNDEIKAFTARCNEAALDLEGMLPDTPWQG